jgi:WS/DGAT/MGAT family acyltransferase
MPEGAEPVEYIKNLLTELRSFDRAIPPFGCRVKTLLGYPIGLQPVKTMNMSYHVQHHQVTDVNDRVAMDDVVASMHETRLDPDKPLWQFHILHDDHSHRYAIYIRVHHMYGDGATLVRWFQTGYLDHPQSAEFAPVWAVKKKRIPRPRAPFLKRFWQGLVNFVHVTRDLIVILIRLLLRLVRINRHYMPVPFTGTKTVFTGQVKAGRSVATMDINFERVRKLGKRCRATANEILLCAFDIGVHRFLQDHGHTFKKALLTNVPINLRKPGETTGGNKIAIVPVQLAHGEQDPYLRLRQIIYHHRIVKNAAQRANPASFSAYTVIIQSIALIMEWCRISDYCPPIANILVSNVPGPAETRYLKDSKLIANYPVSTMTPGGGVNITLMTYDGMANIGMVCGNRNVENLQPLARYVEEAFNMLEQSADDPTLSIDDIGEHEEEVPVSIVNVGFDAHHDNQNLSR